jgi:predicted PurR-regulated permease PerM
MNCPVCGSPLQQRSRFRLFMTGFAFIACALALLLVVHLMLAMLTAVFLAAIGTYLLTWAVKANGAWCRTCKSFPDLPGV